MKAKFTTYCNKHGNRNLEVEKDGEYWILNEDDAEALYYFLCREFFPTDQTEEDTIA